MSAIAYQQGFNAACDYNACNPPTNELEKEAYIQGYADGMDFNIQEENGICSDTPSPLPLTN